MNVNEIKLGRDYFFLNAGGISRIIFLEITERQAQIIRFDDRHTRETNWFLADMGIDFPGSEYENDLNMVFETEKEAEEMVSSIGYRMALARHDIFIDDMLKIFCVKS
jgi:hypothetical protein